MYEMLSGKVPFAGDNTVSVALLHIQGEAMPLRELDPEIPVSVDKIVQKCMQKRPERRYHSASELIADLKRAISNPDGDFVQIPAYVAPDSPTINISDDLNKIKSNSYIEDDTRPTKNLQPAKVPEDDDEDLDTVDSKVEKVFMIGTIVTAIILALVVIIIVVWFLVKGKGSNKNDNNNPTVTMGVTPTLEPIPSGTPESELYNIPDVLGQKEEDAKAAINALDPDAYIRMADAEYSDKYEKGQVMKQYPEADQQLKKGSTIFLTLSLGAESVDVPNVYGQTEANAEDKLTEKGLEVKHEYEANDTVPKGTVISTTPERGATVKAGDIITLLVSDGPSNTQVEVPDLRGKTQKEAKLALEKAGLVLGAVDTKPSNDYKKGQVTYQSYTSKEKVDRGTSVDITISDGPETTNYLGSTLIDINPFETLNMSEDSANILLVLEQDGEQYDIFQGQLSSSDFPYPFPDYESNSGSTGKVTMFVNGKAFVMPGDNAPYTWDMTFEPEGN
jgi:serine/threonine-protein kinase